MNGSYILDPNDIHLSGKFSTNANITVCTKVQNPIPNSNISGLHVSENGEIYLITESGSVYKSNKFRKANELKFEELKFLKHKVKKLTTGFNFLTILTDDNRCLSSLDSDKTNLIESNKLKKLDVMDIESGTAHILASVVPKGKKIKMKKLINAVITNIHDNESETTPDDPPKVVNAENGEIEANGNEEQEGNDNDDEVDTPITIEAISCPSSVQDENEDDQEIRFINEGIEITNMDENVKSPESKNHVTIDPTVDVENHENGIVERPKTPMVHPTEEMEIENDIPDNIIDREEQSDNEADTSPIESLNESPTSDYSLEEYVKEEEKQEANNNHVPVEIDKKVPSNMSNGKSRKTSSNGKIKKMFSDMKSKSICGSNSTVLESKDVEVQMSKACVLM